MARIRSIKPEFFTSEDIVSLSPLARLLYIAIWCEADREGRLQWKPRTLKMRYLPADVCDIEVICREIVSAGLVILYGEGLAYIPSFAAHQHINPRESASKFPTPDGASLIEVDASRRVGTRAHQDLTRREEGEGREGKGKEGEADASRRVDQPLPPPRSAELEVERITSRRALFDRIEGLCRTALGSHQPHDLRIGPMIELVEQGYSERQIVDALSSAARRPRKKPVSAWSLWAKIILEDELPPLKKPSEGDVAKLSGPTIAFKSGANWPVQFVVDALREFDASGGQWPRTALGPAPGEAGCDVPADLIAQHLHQPAEAAA